MNVNNILKNSLTNVMEENKIIKRNKQNHHIYYCSELWPQMLHHVLSKKLYTIIANFLQGMLNCFKSLFWGPFERVDTPEGPQNLVRLIFSKHFLTYYYEFQLSFDVESWLQNAKFKTALFFWFGLLRETL